MPRNKIPTISSDVATGRRMKGAERPPFMRSVLCHRLHRSVGCHEHAFLQFVLACCDNGLAGCHPTRDDRLAVARLTDRDLLDMRLRALVDDVGEETVRP